MEGVREGEHRKNQITGRSRLVLLPYKRQGATGGKQSLGTSLKNDTDGHALWYEIQEDMKAREDYGGCASYIYHYWKTTTKKGGGRAAGHELVGRIGGQDRGWWKCPDRWRNEIHQNSRNR